MYYLLFGINLKRNIAPGIGKNKPWTKELNVEEKEVLEDSSIHLPSVPPQKIKYSELQGTILQSSTTATRSRKSQLCVSNSNTNSIYMLQSSMNNTPFRTCLIPVSKSNHRKKAKK